jgi:hypothetical protein
LLNLYEGYEKINHGCDAAELIGLALMREKCYLFNRWLNALEALSPGQDSTNLGNSAPTQL